MWALVWVHTLAIGTDAGTPLMVGLAAASAGLVAAAIVLRLMSPRGPVGNKPAPEKVEVMQ